MLRYSERYFPEEIFQDERQEYDEDDYQPRNNAPQFRQAAQQPQRQQPVSPDLNCRCEAKIPNNIFNFPD